MDSVASARRTFDDFMKKYDVSVFLRYIDIQALHTVPLILESRELVVMRREKRPDMRFIIAKILNCSPCNRQSVVSACPSSDFVENNQASCLRIV